MSEGRNNKAVGYQLVGWLLFVVCAVLFLASGLKNDDIYATTGSIVFLVACVVFLIPIVRDVKKM